ncbi:D-hexose-6-phosphate mutarotase [Solemya pervernicosa gill symbiont]|uniref:Putative glucose-6-phosphate 1-epimerase n=2 Tax=Gammaproteobacteria incertae sedis TaxID=118884 RepID=A0A1T2L5Y4_9GAMM|nr:D-hexose-6-phosphate mutarotase [Candidatus Reidiella endopervernicosa]OOZ40464.1 D-hexose-6-phosphate mutarotase [Solemya pervernicosa gill symbiont]QKQ25354.1 D-hexose-6-phosphate mutarotase [Candidatus Reidiella endopervernicosa]
MSTNSDHHPHTINGRVALRNGKGDLPVVDITAVGATASVALQGAHLLSWIPEGGAEVIWVSEDAKFAPGKSVRGGVPICWPWFGPHTLELSYPAHGFARTIDWELSGSALLESGEVELTLRPMLNSQAKSQWPHATELEYRIAVGKQLRFALTTRNEGSDAFTIGQALHTYFAVGDASQISIGGLDGCPYLDKVDGFERKQQSGDVSISEETDRIYLESSIDCTIDDPALQRRIRINKSGSNSTIVWNPWIETAEKMGDLGENGYLKMVCVESANAADDVVTIDPGGEHTLQIVYSVESLV